MLSQKSVLSIPKNSKQYLFICENDSPIDDVKSSLLEMLGFVQTIIDNANKAKEVAEQAPEVVASEEV